MRTKAIDRARRGAPRATEIGADRTGNSTKRYYRQLGSLAVWLAFAATAVATPREVNAGPKAKRSAARAPELSPAGREYLQMEACQSAINQCEWRRQHCIPSANTMLRVCALDPHERDPGECAGRRIDEIVPKCMTMFGTCIERAQRLCLVPTEVPTVLAESGSEFNTRQRFVPGGSGGGTIEKVKGKGGGFGERRADVETVDAPVKKEPIVSVRLGGLVGDAGGDDSAKGDIARKVAGRAAAVKACYEAALQEDPATDAMVKVDFTVGVAGTITDVSVTAAVAALRDCVQSKFRSIRGLPVLSAPSKFTQAFKFTSSWPGGAPPPRVPVGSTLQVPGGGPLDDKPKPLSAPMLAREPGTARVAVAVRRGDVAPDASVEQDSAILEASKFEAMARKASHSKLKILYLEKATRLDPGNPDYRRELKDARELGQGEER